MIIRDGAEITIRARLVERHSDGSANIRWEPAIPSEQGEVVAHAVNCHEALLTSLKRCSDWMREFTGPNDGTLYILIDAHEAIKFAERK